MVDLKPFIDVLHNPQHPQCRGTSARRLCDGSVALCALGEIALRLGEGKVTVHVEGSSAWMEGLTDFLDRKLPYWLSDKIELWNDQKKLTFSEIADRLENR